jgi:hypothetical protein
MGSCIKVGNPYHGSQDLILNDRWAKKKTYLEITDFFRNPLGFDAL